MKNTIKMFGTIRSIVIIALVAVIGFSLASCNGGGSSTDGINYLDVINLSNATPTADALSPFGLSQEQFNQIRNAVPNFRG